MSCVINIVDCCAVERSTTPTCVFELDIEPSLLKECWVIFEQFHKVIFQKSLDECEIDDEQKTLSVELTEDETMLLNKRLSLYTQIRAKFQDDSINNSNIMQINVANILENDKKFDEIDGGNAKDTRFKDLIEGSLTEINDDTITEIQKYSFYYNDVLTTVHFGLATSIGMYAFYWCGGLTTAYFPLVANIGEYAFYNCAKLTLADFPSVTYIKKYAFCSCVKLYSLILRVNIVCTLSNVNSFSDTPISEGTGYIYVPKDLIEDYKVATNWSTYADQFRALEDYTVDGTTTGEFDESKI